MNCIKTISVRCLIWPMTGVRYGAVVAVSGLRQETKRGRCGRGRCLKESPSTAAISLIRFLDSISFTSRQSAYRRKARFLFLKSRIWLAVIVEPSSRRTGTSESTPIACRLSITNPPESLYFCGSKQGISVPEA